MIYMDVAGEQQWKIPRLMGSDIKQVVRLGGMYVCDSMDKTGGHIGELWPHGR